MAQAIVGGDSDAEVSHLFAWVYGWVGVALVSAFVFPIWTWLSPFTTLHAIGARILRAIGVEGLEPAPYPEALKRWPAVIGFAAVVWLELVAFGASSRTLGLVIAVYTIYSLAMMAQFGRETWNRRGETFSVWFGLLGRLAPFALVPDGADGELRRRPFAGGLLEGGWAFSDVVLVGLGTGSILFDGLSQTQPWVNVFGVPAALPETLILDGLPRDHRRRGRDRVTPRRRLGDRRRPPADRRRIPPGPLLHLPRRRRPADRSSPSPIPSSRARTCSGRRSSSRHPRGCPPGFVWTLQLGAVVGGHMIGAWAGHVVAAGTMRSSAASAIREIRMRQVPLAVVMVALTTLTLWSLGQALFVPTG